MITNCRRRFINSEFTLVLQLKRYKTYVYLLSSHLNSNQTDLINIIISAGNTAAVAPATSGATAVVPEGEREEKEDELRSLTSSQGTNRYSYRAAIYRSEQDIG
jgi:hypothetical protein